jgi:hypothetical protein
MEKKRKIRESIRDEDLKTIIKKRLKADPVYYTDFLKELIDSLPVKTISLETISGLPFDYFFYPEARKTIKEWQQIYRDEKSDRKARNKAKRNLQEVGQSLTKKGQGRPPKVTQDIKLEIIYDSYNFDRILWKSKERGDSLVKLKKILKKCEFPSEQLTKANYSPEYLRNWMIAKRYRISLRQVEEILRSNKKDIKFIRQELGYEATTFMEEAGDEAEELTNEDKLQVEALLKAEGNDFDRKWKEISKKHIP